MRSSVVITLSVAVAAITGLVLLTAAYGQDFSERSIAASLLILSFVVFGGGGFLYTGRAIWKWPAGQTPVYLLWERGFVIVAVLATTLGLALLADTLEHAETSVWARLGMVTYLIGVVIVVVAETSYLGRHDWVYPQIVVYVVLAFLAQAAFGEALLHSDLVARWVGWATILWNLSWLVVLCILSPNNVYFPALHHVAPLLIGIALLVQG